MRYFIDTEFIEDGRSISLLSIGIVAEDGREYYAVKKYNDPAALYLKADEWVTQNVLPLILPDVPNAKYSWEIASDILDFVGVNTNPQFWGDFAAYDWVALCQIFGRMICLPDGWPMFCRDIQQAKYETDVRVFLEMNEKPHHALCDARETKSRFDYLVEHGLRP